MVGTSHLIYLMRKDSSWSRCPIIQRTIILLLNLHDRIAALTQITTLRAQASMVFMNQTAGSPHYDL